jgi:prepilin-type N-terminal cleavage/methylation domain-containing protein
MVLRNNRGYSLIELMIVVVIIGILAALAIPKFIEATKKAKEAEGKILAKSAYKAVHSYMLFNDACPANLTTAGFPETIGKYYRLRLFCFNSNLWIILASPLNPALGLDWWILFQDGTFW